jgi:hypothetical protein
MLSLIIQTVYVLSIHLFVILCYHFRAMRYVSTALVGGGDKPPCATGRVRNRAVIIAWKCRYSTSSNFIGYVSCKFQVMLSVPQSSLISSVFQFCVVALGHFIFIVVSGSLSLRGECRRPHLALISVSSWCAHQISFLSVRTSAAIFIQTTFFVE